VAAHTTFPPFGTSPRPAAEAAISNNPRNTKIRCGLSDCITRHTKIESTVRYLGIEVDDA
jgi:hypothetical protein